MRFKFDRKKSEKLRKDPRRRIGFDEVQEIGKTRMVYIIT